ncbi:MAG TPA: hypothetical protein VFP84_30275 [Kofleriaceae bacterium]|nr:hypothetical protein [Kofleriaceae bacterium]
MRTWIVAALAASVVGCAYRPGAFEYANHTFPGERATVGCLDVAVERRADMPVGPVLGFQFANRCDRVAPIDLGSVRVVGRDRAGRETPLVAYDPDREIRLVWLDGRSANGEALAYGLDADGVQPAPPVTEVCVDVATMARSQPAQWRCFATRDVPAPPVTLGQLFAPARPVSRAASAPVATPIAAAPSSIPKVLRPGSSPVPTAGRTAVGGAP